MFYHFKLQCYYCKRFGCCCCCLYIEKINTDNLKAIAAKKNSVKASRAAFIAAKDVSAINDAIKKNMVNSVVNKSIITRKITSDKNTKKQITVGRLYPS